MVHEAAKETGPRRQRKLETTPRQQRKQETIPRQQREQQTFATEAEAEMCLSAQQGFIILSIYVNFF